MAAHDLLLGRWFIVEVDAGNAGARQSSCPAMLVDAVQNALQLAHCLLQDNRELPSDRRRVHANQVEHRRYATLPQLRADSPPDAPDLRDSSGRENSFESAAVIAPRLQT